MARISGSDQLLQMKYNSTQTLQKRFEELDAERSGVIRKSERFAKWTLPNVIGNPYPSPSDEAQHDYQSIGARSVNHLANKLAFSLFNPARSFFKLEAQPEYKKVLAGEGLTDIALTQAFVKIENEAMRRFVTWRSRTAAIFALKSLIIAGNSLMYFPNDGKAQVFNLRDYVIMRDLSGKALEIITRDRKKVATLPEKLRTLVLSNPRKRRTDKDDADLFTRIIWNPDTKKYHVFQAVDDFPIMEVNGLYLEKELPWIPLTWDLARGQDYGSGLVEEYGGDFHALSTLSYTMVIGAAVAADIKFLVDPAGNTDYKMLNDADTGSYVPGRPEDISPFSVEKKMNDFKFVTEMINAYEKRIGLAFLLGSAVTRQAERVTAEEIRFQANELETGLGGQYSRLAEEFQMPMAYILLKDVDFSIAGKQVDPIIVTGLESLSRTSEVENLILFFQDLALLAQLPDTVQRYLKVPEVTATFGSARSVEYEKFLKTEEEVQAEDERIAKQQIELQNATEQNTARNQAAQANMTKE